MLGGGGGGANGSKMFPGFLEENRVHRDHNTLPQLQLFGPVPIHCGGGVGTVNYIGGGQTQTHEPADNFPVNQKLQMSLNNYCQDETGHIGTVLNRNHVSIGLKLSCEEEERNSSVTSACENVKSNPPVIALSLGNTVQMEIDQQTEEFGRYIKLQEESILKGIREINQRHMVSLLKTLEKGVNKKLHEKEVEIESMNRKNKELEDKIKQVAMEGQAWHGRSKYNESVINVLKSNIQQLMAQGTAHGREGSGDSEVDDAVSSSNHHRVIRNQVPKCRACNGKDVSILILPCRHLCLCTDCEGFIDICPVCQVMKSASVHVYM